jgi:hypothetical protein
MDDALRNSLWSALSMCYWEHVNHNNDIFPRYYLSNYGNENLNMLFKRMWLHYFKKPIDAMPDEWDSVFGTVRGYFFKSEWYEVYDFIEFVSNNYELDATNDRFRGICNNFMEREMSAYRFVQGKITPITSAEEISEIEDALNIKKTPVKEHLRRALELLSDRKTPDYRNSIKESISAVEAMAIIITGEDKPTLGQMLAILERKANLHSALKEAFSKLYGYTSNAGGIRHALLDESDTSFAEAKFMMVACSAFVNYVGKTIEILM